MGLHVKQFHDLILEPTLQSLYPAIPHGDVARLLVLETMWHESGALTFLRQHPNGPALGLCQMERPTFDWLMDELKTRQSFRGILGRLGAFSPNWPSIMFEELAWNMKLAVAFVRLRYYIVPLSLPTPPDGLLVAGKG